jgi:hypothetical protein
MPNYCDNELHFDCSKEDFETLIKPLLSGENCMGELKELTFNTLIPMPDDVFRGPVGPEERAKYGRNNWYDWCCYHWGTKWDASDARVEYECVQFTTAWNSPRPWYEALARELDAHGIKAHADYCAEGGFPGSLGGYDLEDGACFPTEADPEFVEKYTYDDEEEE